MRAIAILKAPDSAGGDTYVDPLHGVPLPRGRALHQVLRLILDRQRLAVNEWMRTLKRLPRKAPSLANWTQPIADATAPAIATYQRQGARQFIFAVLQQLKRARRENAGKSIGLGTGTSIGRVSRLRLRSPMEPTTVEEILADAFLVFNTEVADAARMAAWNFAASTNATAVGAITQAIADAREALAKGLEQGQALAVMTARVQQHFADPIRAARIAATESSRAVHAGQQAVAVATGGLVTRKKWLASSDACPRCQKLNGLEVPLDQHFAVDGGTGPYAVIEHPPAHPGCMCAMTQEVDL